MAGLSVTDEELCVELYALAARLSAQMVRHDADSSDGNVERQVRKWIERSSPSEAEIARVREFLGLTIQE